MLGGGQMFLAYRLRQQDSIRDGAREETRLRLQAEAEKIQAKVDATASDVADKLNIEAGKIEARDMRTAEVVNQVHALVNSDMEKAKARIAHLESLLEGERETK